ncbi:hypothetical protein HDK77DRAFT_476199 [Phyllosticta capitalensis]|uniref:uncharacterized protein n=1 Tax=Phyllosticta capitalensis TaxID=121624 RepID=UPI0031320F37
MSNEPPFDGPVPLGYNKLASRMAEEKEISDAVGRQQWNRASDLAHEALRDPELPLWFRGLYEAYLATMPGQELHTREHYDKCREAIEAIEDNTRNDPRSRQGSREHIDDLRGCLKHIEELMDIESAKAQSQSQSQSTPTKAQEQSDRDDTSHNVSHSSKGSRDLSKTKSPGGTILSPYREHSSPSSGRDLPHHSSPSSKKPGE